MSCVFEAKWSWPQINCIIAEENVHRQTLDRCSYFMTKSHLQNQAEVRIWYLRYNWLMTKMEPLPDCMSCFQRLPQRLHAYHIHIQGRHANAHKEKSRNAKGLVYHCKLHLIHMVMRWFVPVISRLTQSFIWRESLSLCLKGHSHSLYVPYCGSLSSFP